jgi:outer membrane lipoprotein-sorting protein
MIFSLKPAARIVSLLFVITGMSGLAMAEKMSLSPEQEESINKISSYMNSFETLQGEFTQTSPMGKISTGTMFLSKPGKLRFDYAAPNPFLLVSDGTWVTLKNRAKEKGDQFPLSATPLRFVVSKKIDLLKDADVVEFENVDGITTVVLEDPDGVLGGRIVLTFDETQNQLQQWVIVDGKGRRTTVQLANLETGVDLDPKLFQVKINRKDRSTNR